MLSVHHHSEYLLYNSLRFAHWVQNSLRISLFSLSPSLSLSNYYRLLNYACQRNDINRQQKCSAFLKLSHFFKTDCLSITLANKTHGRVHTLTRVSLSPPPPDPPSTPHPPPPRLAPRQRRGMVSINALRQHDLLMTAAVKNHIWMSKALNFQQIKTGTSFLILMWCYKIMQ